MSFRVDYTDRAGAARSSTFGSKAQADMYAKTVKGARVSEVATAAPVVAVQACPVGTAEAQREAAKAYYRAHGRQPEVVTRCVRDTESPDQREEREREHYAEYAVCGLRHLAQADWQG
jgi:dsDNA-binding SOS-regulon protein